MSPTTRRFALAAIFALAVYGMCYHPSRLPSEPTAAEYDVYRAYLASHPGAGGRRVLVQRRTDGERVMLCAHLMTSDNNLLWELIRNDKTFPLDGAVLGAPTVDTPPATGAYELVKFTRVSLAGWTGVLQVSTTDCDPSGCTPERREVFTTSKHDGRWEVRSPGCVRVDKPQVAGTGQR